MKTALNNLLTRARLALINGEYDKAAEMFYIASIMTKAIDAGETENTEHGKYLIEYSRGMHR